MKKKIKTTHKKNTRILKKRIENSTIIKFISFALLILVVVFSGKILSGLSKTHVLGASVGPILLADHGGDSSGGGDTGNSGSSGGSGGGDQSNNSSGNSGGGQPSNSGGSSGGDNHSDNASTSNSGDGSSQPSTSQSTVSDSTKVDCVGPDGKHFTTEFHDCQELNQKWGKSNFNFTPLATQTNNEQEKPEPSVAPEQKDTTENKTGKIEVQTEGNKGELNLESQGLHIEIKREDNGKLSIHAHQEDGQEVTLKSNALDQINESLKDQEIEVSTTAANTIAITSHNVAAHTTLPVSIDPSTKVLAITTPTGTKDVTVLPNEAVQNILHSNILSNVLSQNLAQPTGSASNRTAVIGLTTLNNQPVFEIQGVKQKHLLGIFPVAFPKTVTVSAQTGQVISTQENTLNQVLESLSI